jgi:large subunit ribosomal protein L28
MAYKCDSCGKGILVGRNVSHAKNRTRRISFPNLHPFKGRLKGKEGKWLLCTKCLRKAKKLQKESDKKVKETDKREKKK